MLARTEKYGKKPSKSESYSNGQKISKRLPLANPTSPMQLLHSSIEEMDIVQAQHNLHIRIQQQRIQPSDRHKLKKRMMHMAFLTDTFSAHSTFGDKIAALWTGIKEENAKRIVYNTTVRELNTLSDRELADLGIHRSMIRRLALDTAYKI
jgi:uncharacterized protein YjiS (DUF1127 family)